MTTNEIKANYLNIYRDVFRVKTDFEKVKIPHDQVNIKNIVYTVAHGTMDWIRDTKTTFVIGIMTSGTDWFSGIYRISLISKHQFNIIIYGKTYPDNTATFIFNGREQQFIIVAVNISTDRSKITWILEFIAETDIPNEF